MRDPKDIMHNGRTVAEILRLHSLWLAAIPSERANLRGADLFGANLRGVDLRGANLSGANLSGAFFSGADLFGANLYSAFLYGANLSGANLSGAFFSGADLSGANLSGAFLYGANLSGANLSGADLRGAFLSGADLSGAFLRGTLGNMREVKSAHFDKWGIAWTTAPDGTITLQIGCQKHDLALWEKSDPRWIAAMDDNASDWWAKYRDVVLTLVKTSPAKPWVEKEKTDNDRL